MVKILSCPKCKQYFVYVFSETIDWADGDDPQFRSVLPITPSESKQLSEAGGNLEALLNALAPSRRSLCHDFPKGDSPKIFWSSGMSIGQHD